MITGYVRNGFEPIIELIVGGSTGVQVPVSAIVDTGFSEYLTLPPVIIQELGLTPSGSVDIRLGDGSMRRTTIYLARVLWESSWMRINVEETNGDILVGMALLNGCNLNIDVVLDGNVSVAMLD
ncbi:MAG TPA: hypothetical protein VGK19_09075 [Capsulimonadaceae bacterium]|jgi:clan AA aspartic protease